MRSPGRSRWRVTLLATAALWQISNVAVAHSPGGGDVHAVRAEPSAEWQGVTVQVVQTLAPQLVIENNSGKLIEILDDRGRAFLRVGPDGVEGDFGASAWYNTVGTDSRVPESARSPDSPENWRRVRAEPSWGWFDPRLATGKIKVPEKVRHAGKPADVAAWSVPARVDGHATAIHGQFRFTPLPRGHWRASLTLPPELSPDLTVSVVQGGTPALFLSNHGADSLTVFGLEDEPYLRIGASGVEFNPASSTWRNYGRSFRGGAAKTLPATGDGEIQWQLLSSGSSYTWLEPRAAGAEESPSGTAKAPLRNWEIPVLLGQRRLVLKGITEWVPNEVRAASAK